MADDLVLVATFGAPHGVKGEVRIKSFTAEPLALLDYSPLVARDGRTFSLVALRPQGDMLVARVSEIADRSAAERVTRLNLFVPRARLPQPADDDEFMHADLIGLSVVDAAGARIGTVTGVFDFGAGDVLDVARVGAKGVMIPFTRAMVPVVDLSSRRLVVDLPPGFLEDEPPPVAGT